MEFTDLCRAGTLSIAPHRAVDPSWEQATTAVWPRRICVNSKVERHVVGTGALLLDESADVATAPIWVSRARAPFPRAQDPMDVRLFRILALAAVGLIFAVTLFGLLTPR